MEVFLQKNASGGWEQQPVVLQHSRAEPRSVSLAPQREAGATVADPPSGELEDAELPAAASTASIGSLRRAPAALMHVSRDHFVVVPGTEECGAGGGGGGGAATAVRMEAVNAKDQPVALDLPLTEASRPAGPGAAYGRI